ncbi:MAG: hypothetical protein J6Q39_06465 [Bacteroidales bacterium]|nr:hypothetical protein [Bacteroidales bacterium]
MKRIFLVLFVLINMCTNAQSTNFKLQEDKFYKVESLILGDIVLPFEAEIAYFKWGGEYGITFCQGDGNGNVETVELYNAKYSEKDGGGFLYTLDWGRGTLELMYLKDEGVVLVGYYRAEHGLSYLIMDPTPYDAPVLKRP